MDIGVSINGGTLNHPFLDGIFPNKPSTLGYPPNLWKPGHAPQTATKPRSGAEQRDVRREKERQCARALGWHCIQGIRGVHHLSLTWTLKWGSRVFSDLIWRFPKIWVAPIHRNCWEDDDSAAIVDGNIWPWFGRILPNLVELMGHVCAQQLGCLILQEAANNIQSKHGTLRIASV